MYECLGFSFRGTCREGFRFSGFRSSEYFRFLIRKYGGDVGGDGLGVADGECGLGNGRRSLASPNYLFND